MKKSYKTTLIAAAGSAIFLALCSSTVAGTTNSTDVDRIIQEQQRQLNVQAGEIATLKEQLQTLLDATVKNTNTLADKVDKKEVENLKFDKMVRSKKKNVNITLYGQINRAALLADNGDSSKTYFVDNARSSTRMGVAAKAKVSDDVALGGKIEYSVISNSSNKVDQYLQSSSASLDLRHADLFMKSKTAGKISLGHGSTASDGSAEMDLSATGVAAGSSVADIAGGQFWYNDGTDPELSTTVKRTIGNMDGLSRKDRIRYDTPSFGGFSLAASAIETGGYDAAARYSRKFGDSALAVAVAWATPGNLKKWDNQVDGSISYFHGSGFNITFAGGQQSYDIADKDDATYWYGKLGYRAELVSPGMTAFSVDYGNWNDFIKNNDEAKSFGFAFVQNVTDWGTEVYVSYRLYELDRTDYNYDNINAVIAGARMKF